MTWLRGQGILTEVGRLTAVSAANAVVISDLPQRVGTAEQLLRSIDGRRAAKLSFSYSPLTGEILSDASSLRTPGEQPVLVSGRARYTGPEMVVDFSQQSIRDVIAALMKQLGLEDFQIDASVSGEVSLRLVDTRADVALLVLLWSHGFEHRFEQGSVYIYSREAALAWSDTSSLTVPFRAWDPVEAEKLARQLGMLTPHARVSVLEDVRSLIINDHPLVLKQLQLLFETIEADAGR